MAKKILKKLIFAIAKPLFEFCFSVEAPLAELWVARAHRRLFWAQWAAKNGTLPGYTLVEREDGQKYLHQHEYEFKSKEDLAHFLKPHFRNVTVFETIFPERHNLCFWASDTTVPFGKSWPGKTGG